MAINFPDSPANGATHVAGAKTFVYNSTTTSWSVQSGSSVDITSITGDILPDADSSRSLGSASKKWKDLFLSGSTISLGNIKLKEVSGALKVETNAGADVSLGSATSYANFAAFPSSGNNDGDLGFATDTKSSYMWDGVAWQRMSMGPQIGPRYTTTPSTTHALNIDGTANTLTAVAVDESGFPVTYDWDAFSGSTLYNDDSLPSQITSLSESNGVFTLTPSTAEANAGNFSFRVKASDGVLVTPATSVITLAFKTPITIAARQTRGSNYVEPTSTSVTLVNMTNSTSGSNYVYFPEGTTVANSGMTTGKRYIEAKWTSTTSGPDELMVGIAMRLTAHGNNAAGGYLGANAVYVYANNGNHFGWQNNSASGLGAFSLNDVWQIAYDTDAGKVWVGKNDTWSSVSGDPSAGGTGISLSHAQGGYAFVVGSGSNTTFVQTLTWGGSDYTKPTGFEHF